MTLRRLFARAPRRILAALLVAALAPAPAAPAPAAPAARPYPLSEVRPGLLVEAHTVFQGERVETFGLEVLGVLEQGAAQGALILARATEPRVEHTGIVAGMSGSPVYAADGRLLGAIAYAWGFSKDPICGITPIGEMLPIWELAEESSPEAFGRAGESGAPAAAAPGASGALPRLRTPLAAAGFAPQALAWLEPWARERGFLLTPGGLAPAAPAAAGSASTGTAPQPRRLAPGDAIAVDLLRGDAGLAAIGTVTAVRGDRVLAFGHPFFLGGPTRLPLSRAAITAILPSLQSSFKIGTSLELVGTLTEDRRAGVAGRLGPAPEMLPLAVRVRVPGAPESTFHFQAAKHRALAPQIVAVAAVNAALARGALPGESTWRWRVTAELRGAPARRLDLADLAPGDGLPIFQTLATLVSGLVDNPWEPVDLERVDIALEVVPRRDELRVTAIRLARSRVRPGESVRVEVDLAAHRGGTSTATLEYRVPPGSAAGALTLFVGGGADWARYDAREAPGRHRAGSTSELLRRLADAPRAARLYLAVYGGPPEASLRGRDYPGLPPSAQRLLAGAGVADASARWARATLAGQVARDYDAVVTGGTVLTVEVDPEAPAGHPARRPASPGPPPGDDPDGAED